ncbi:NAD-dependent epimerase/dehydratase family protein [Prosthecomicrobium pneumaticum]|uniref:UDP-glucose 4-epimerase n=1 Tax=Prosthecomicrobium pneumaticum TaxID=81895 RepID=A0A7W9L1X3_9HYPH|nr:NAD(P)-dependent oxidoreductase [Prosthecomicrobium pneumaticum]MBB5753069.1 UDP-glucose 4-epimerase [Prosthecomicrobium pneumaticum]
MNVLLTGGAGLLGMALRPLLAARGHRVTATDVTDYGRGDRDLAVLPLDDRAGFEALVARDGIEAIIHCGAISGPMLFKGQPVEIVQVNIDGTAMLLDLARIAGMRRFVFCSSISVYGDVGPARITEATPLRPTSVYGATKVAGEQLIRGFAAEYGLSGVALRIARVYGPYRRANCHLGNLVRDALAGRPTEIPCDPAFPYHYVYADDVAEAMIAALEVPTLPDFEYNVGTGVAHTMPEIAAIARGALPGADPRLVPGADDVPDRQTEFDVAKIARELGWRARFDLAAGLADHRRHVEAGAAA